VALSQAQLRKLAADAARANGIPVAGFLALINQESGFDPGAKSPAGALGIAQFMPNTAAGLRINPLDPTQALPASAKHLAALRRNLGSWDLALAGYNAGGGAVKKYGGVPPYRETQNYVSKLGPYFKGAAGAPALPASAPSAASADPQAQLQAAAPHVDARALLSLLQRTSQATLKGQAPGQDYMRALMGIISKARINPQAERMGSAAAEAGDHVHEAATTPRAYTGAIPLQPGLSPIDNGQWGGSKAKALGLAPFAFQNGLKVSSHKRDRQMTASGGVSDHYKGNANAYAFDFGWGGASPTPQADRAASAMVASLGGPKNWGRTGGNFVITRGGFRYQIIYRSNVGGNHYNHIHLGVRRV
jgi:hypothetical protein